MRRHFIIEIIMGIAALGFVVTNSAESAGAQTTKSKVSTQPKSVQGQNTKNTMTPLMPLMPFNRRGKK